MFNPSEPFKIQIERAQFEFLKSVFEKSINNKIGQTDQPNKGTGKWIVLSEKAVCIFEMGSVQRGQHSHLFFPNKFINARPKNNTNSILFSLPCLVCEKTIAFSILGVMG